MNLQLRQSLFESEFSMTFPSTYAYSYKSSRSRAAFSECSSRLYLPREDPLSVNLRGAGRTIRTKASEELPLVFADGRTSLSDAETTRLVRSLRVALPRNLSLAKRARPHLSLSSSSQHSPTRRQQRAQSAGSGARAATAGAPARVLEPRVQRGGLGGGGRAVAASAQLPAALRRRLLLLDDAHARLGLLHLPARLAYHCGRHAYRCLRSTLRHHRLLCLHYPATRRHAHQTSAATPGRPALQTECVELLSCCTHLRILVDTIL